MALWKKFKKFTYWLIGISAYLIIGSYITKYVLFPMYEPVPTDPGAVIGIIIFWPAALIISAIYHFFSII